MLPYKVKLVLECFSIFAEWHFDTTGW